MTCSRAIFFFSSIYNLLPEGGFQTVFIESFPGRGSICTAVPLSIHV